MTPDSAPSLTMPTSATTLNDTAARYMPPKQFSDYLTAQWLAAQRLAAQRLAAQRLAVQLPYCLFLDIDGTLAEFTLDPKQSVIPKSTLKLLQQIQSCGVEVAIVTGRSLVEARQMLWPLDVPIAATHGLEIAIPAAKSVLHRPNHAHTSTADNKDGSNNKHSLDKKDRLDSPYPPTHSTSLSPLTELEAQALVSIKHHIAKASKPYPQLHIENKPYSCALHYRQNPTLANVAYTLMTNALDSHANWQLKQGKYVWEAVPKGVNKGTAILTLLTTLTTLANRPALCPIFIGDDITDEAGFMAVQGYAHVNDKHVNERPAQLPKLALSNPTLPITNLPLPLPRALPQPLTGIGIKVGTKPTCASHYVQTIAEVTMLLEQFLSFCQQHGDHQKKRDCHASATNSNPIASSQITKFAL